METSRLVPLDATLLRHFEAGDPDAATRVLERANLEAVHRLLGAVVAEDYDALIEELADDAQIELFAPPEFPFVRKATGKEAVRAMITHNFGTVVDQQPEILSVTAQGDTLMMVAKESGRIRYSDQPYDVHFVYNFRIQDGKIAHVRQFASYTSWAHTVEPQ